MSSLSKLQGTDHQIIDMDLKRLLRNVDVEHEKSSDGQVDSSVPKLLIDNEVGSNRRSGSSHDEESVTLSPKMTEYDSFEEYLDALVSHDTNTSSATGEMSCFVDLRMELEEERGYVVNTKKTVEHGLDSFFENLENL